MGKFTSVCSAIPWRDAPLTLLALCVAFPAFASEAPLPEEDWISLFNGEDLEGWTVKIRGYESGDNFADTFRVEDGMLTVSYDGYEDFNARFGHLFYERPFSHYRLRLEYRFIGEPGPNVEEWAFRNSGAMLHSQPPDTMTVDQDFPISVEFQFLGGLSDGHHRPTGNLCTPGTHVFYQDVFTDTHCINSTAPTFDGDQWVRAEALVLGDERVVHFINGEVVIEYSRITYGGGVVSGHRPEMKPDGEPLGSGHIALQSEGHPIQFRNIELLDLQGCIDPEAANYRPYFVKSDPESCR